MTSLRINYNHNGVAVHIFDWLINFPPELAFAIILFVLLLCGLGLPLPEEIPIFTVAYLTYTNEISLPVAITGTLIAILAGDSMLYWIGYKYGNRIFEQRPFRNLMTPDRLKKANDYFHKYGNKVVPIARFLAGVRGTVFVTAGILRMPFRRFLLLDASVACIGIPINIWFVRYLLNFFGDEVDMALIALRRAGRTVMVVILVVVAMVSAFVYLRKKFKPRTDQVQE